ncbi:sugar ABC transporter ATP-binding protein [Microbacterium suwonense]|uniref:Ribose/galactose/methyl galactoside import ATP-binding protein 3 n=1 Tax=Microbacterium suwonense TaxID=683047 RepID=A0ABM8FUE8_9MICO|nr:sugar ABC transporter ATP-binding protein [Microbacterium suwonense]BDZ39318.1 putative ribose/galactose/methyl galactoside import ATP-binding protein 3 [Microbacterium suwonense]
MNSQTIAPTDVDTVLAAHGVGRVYPGVRALDDVSLAIRRGEIIGLVGENGAGKSTLLSILSGSEQPSTGYVETAGGVRDIGSYGEANRRGVFRAHQDQGLIGNLSVTENLYLGHERHFTRAGVLQTGQMRAAAQRHLSGRDVIGSGIDARSMVGELALDQRQLVEITRAFAVAELLGQDHPVVLLDETTASLDQDEVAELFSFVRSTRGAATYVFVSHRLNEILEICDRIYVLKDGKVVAERASADTNEEELHRLMVGRDREANHYLEDKRTGDFGAVALKVDRLGVPGHFADVTLDVRAGEIYGIGGLTGCGKSHLAGAIAGDISSVGAIEAVGRAMPSGRAVSRLGVIGYGPLDRHAEGVSMFQSIRWNTTWSSLKRFTRGGLLSSKREKADVATAMSRHRIVAPGDGTLVGSLSGGNQQKVMLARLVSSGARVLVLDNPTRGVDVGARQEIYSLLRESVAAGLAILMISDDMRELIGMSDRLAVMKDGRLVHEWGTAEVPGLTEETIVARMV